GHLPQRFSIATDRRAEDHEVLHCAAKRDADDYPERAGKKSELGRQCWTNQWTRSRDCREVVAEDDPAIRRHEVAAVVETRRGSRPRCIERENPARDELAVKPVRDCVGAES